jgi:hypothetical protein
MTQEQVALCEQMKRLGYAQDCWVKLYGEVFDLMSDPFCIGACIFVDAWEQRSGRVRRICIPKNVVRTARPDRDAA